MNRKLEPEGQSTRPLLLLTVGAVLGVILAAAGLVRSGRPSTSTLPASAVARVNDELIRSEDYQRAVTGLAQDKRDALDDAQRRHVLDRLIDEELLVQRGLELGLARRDSKLRKDLTAAVIDSVVAEFSDAQPSDTELQEFYDQHRDVFTGAGRIRARQIFCRTPTNADTPMALDRAQQAVRRLRAGEDFSVVRAAVGDPELAPLPDSPLPPMKLIDYLGPTAARALSALEVGAVSDPIRSSTGLHVLQVIERVPDPGPPLDEIKPQVLAEYRRRAGEQALRTYLDDLRRRANVAIAPTLP